MVMMFDCCHSGGIHRSGSSKAKGIDPPDDIRHRGLTWNAELKMWDQRNLRDINPNFGGDDETRTAYMGLNRSTYRLGRAMALRALKETDYKKLDRKKDSAVGPYLPLILEACREEEYAYEYRHGVTSYGAFTYSMASTLRQRKSITFDKLVSEVAKRIDSLGFDQQPDILGPQAVRESKVPWFASENKLNRNKKKVRKSKGQ